MLRGRMTKPATLPQGFWVAVVGIPILILALAGLALWRDHEKGHAYAASCDGRVPNKTCEDFYHDTRSEISCAEPVKLTHTPCDRANVIGGCREQGSITWFYAGSTDPQAIDKKCHLGHQWVPADWKEKESQ